MGMEMYLHIITNDLFNVRYSLFCVENMCLGLLS